MTARSRFSQSQDWDPMRDDYNNSTYDAQYPDDDAGSGVQLDQTRLYITNIPPGLSDAGLRSVFAKFGELIEAYVSKDVTKRFALVKYDTSSEAKLAMMKMNKTEPLKLAISIAHKQNRSKMTDRNDNRDRSSRDHQNMNGYRDKSRDDISSIVSGGRSNRRQDNPVNTDGDMMEDLHVDEDLDLDDVLDSNWNLELELCKLQQLQLQEKQLACKNRILLLKQAGKKQSPGATGSSRRILSNGKIEVRNVNDRHKESRDDDFSFGAGASESNDTTVCSCKTKKSSWQCEDDGSSTPSTCVMCSEDTKTRNTDKSNVLLSRIADVTKETEFGKMTDAVNKRSDVASDRVDARIASKSEVTGLNYSDLYDIDDDEEETNRLIQLRKADYKDVVEDDLKFVIALTEYPKSKMRLLEMALFQKCLNDILNMQLDAGLLKRLPCFIDYYLNKGALVCICKDLYTKNWMIRISPGLQERMLTNFVLLKTKVKRLYLAVMKIPQMWHNTAQDTIKLLQYFNPDLKTHLWKIYAQKVIDNVEVTSFLIDLVSGEIIRGLAFKNVIDYDQIEFELTGYTEIYYEDLLFNMEEDPLNISFRLKLLAELKSEEPTPNILSQNKKKSEIIEQVINVQNIPKKFKKSKKKPQKISEVIEETSCDNIKAVDNKESIIKSNVDVLKAKIKTGLRSDRNHISKKHKDILVWADEPTNALGREIDKSEEVNNHMRTNYLDVKNELSVAMILEGYPKNKLEGTHIEQLKQLFKECSQKDMKNQRSNLIVPTLQDVYLYNGGVVYICDNLETKDYLIELLPKYIQKTGLKLMFTDVKDLVRYTKVVMRLPKEKAHIESMEILLNLQSKYPNLKPDCWQHYSDVVGKQTRRFGVDLESLITILSPDFDPTFEGEKVIFRIIDRQDRDVDFEVVETETEVDLKVKEDIVKSMHAPVNLDIISNSLARIRSNHYSDLISDDLKLYIEPSNYPETRIDEELFHLFKKTFENIAFECYNTGELNDTTVPTFHDLYIFDGVIFVICQNIRTRRWLENVIPIVNSKLNTQLQAIEFRGAVGIVGMVVQTLRSIDDVINILQQNNPRLRTKYWRKISTVRSMTNIDAVLQIDRLSAEVISQPTFNKSIDTQDVRFTLGDFKTMINKKLSLEQVTKKYRKRMAKLAKNEWVPEIESKSPKANATKEQHHVDNKSENSLPEASTSFPKEDIHSLNVTDNISKLTIGDITNPQSNDKDTIDPVITEPHASISDNDMIVPESQANYAKVIVKIPESVLPEKVQELNIILELLENKNPGLNTAVWVVYADSDYKKNGQVTMLVDTQSLSVIRGKNFDGTIGGENLKFYF